MKRIFAFLMILVLLAVTVAADDFDAPSYILIEASTGTVLAEHNADEPLPPASVTKVMTMLLVMEAIDDGRLSPDEPVETSEYAASMGGSQVYLKVGETMTVSEMLKCVVVASANDAAVALAEKVAGSEEAFVSLMNRRAAELGMSNTVFKNTNGLDDTVTGHLTTARDIAVMSRELIVHHPKILEYSSIWTDSIRDGSFGLTNTNRLIRFYRGANGLKTGSTSKAKFCISAAALRDGMQLIAVVMASPTRDARNETAKKLLDYGFANYETKILGQTGMISSLPVVSGKCDSVNVTATAVSVLLGKGEGAKLTVIADYPETLAAPVEAGEEIGSYVYFSGEREVARVKLYAAQGAARLSLWDIFTRMWQEM